MKLRVRKLKSVLKKNQSIKRIEIFKNQNDFLKSFRKDFKIGSKVQVFAID